MEATVIVLEAPVFQSANIKSKVLFYQRKGKSIYLHGALSKKTKSSFYKTILPSGLAGYILKEHVMINYNDIRELDQTVPKFDNTDYRIPEPLVSNYPFLNKTGYRGTFQIALGQPNTQTYPYNQAVLNSSFNLSKEFSFIYTQRADYKKFEDRLYFGAIASLYLSSLDFVMTSQVASQNLTTFAIGPYITYESFKTKNYGLNFHLNFQLVLFNKINIEIRDNDSNISEKREFTHGFSISPNIGSSFNFKKALLGFDLHLGFNSKFILPKTYQARVAAQEPTLWNGDSFEQSLRVELNYFVGLTGYY